MEQKVRGRPEEQMDRMVWLGHEGLGDQLGWKDRGRPEEQMGHMVRLGHEDRWGPGGC